LPVPSQGGTGLTVLSIEILSTDRLFLRIWQESDLSLAKSLWGDPDVMTFLGGSLTDEKVGDKMRAEMVCREKNGVQYWPVFERQRGEFIGCCGLRPWIYTPPAGYELGFHLLKSKWGHGYGFEVARAVVKHAFESLQFPMLRAGHHPDNLNSKKILLRLRFQSVDAVFYRPTGLMHPTYQLRRESANHS
jgi:ribosomal-protein-alanine N-acetyltransferase